MLVDGPQNGDFTRMKNFNFPKFFKRKFLSTPESCVMQYEVKYSDFLGNELGNLKNNRRLSELEFLFIYKQIK